MKRFFIPLACIATTILASYLIFTKEQDAPQISWIDIQGKKQSLQEFRGKVVLVNFWATTCSGCIAEMPKLVDMQKKFDNQGYNTLAVAMQYDDPAQISAFVDKNELPFIVTHDTKNIIATAFGDIQLTPTSFLVNKEGKIIRKYIGEPEGNTLEKDISSLL